MSDEEAKALQEVSKTVGTALEKVNDLERIGNAILGPIGKVWGLGTLWIQSKHDYLSYKWKLENWAKFMELAKRHYERLDIPVEQAIPLPPAIAYEYREGIQSEDNPKLQELWANLLVNTTQPNNPVRPQRLFKNTLKSMETEDAQLFEFLAHFPISGLFKINAISVEGITNKGKVIEDEIRVQLNFESPKEKVEELGHSKIIHMINRYVAESELIDFLDDYAVFTWEPQDLLITVNHLCILGLINSEIRVSGETHNISVPVPIENIGDIGDGINRRRQDFQSVKSIESKRVYVLTEYGRQFSRAVSNPLSN